MADDFGKTARPLEALIASYRDDLKVRLAALEEARQAWRENGGDTEVLRAMISIVHQLAGSSALFGFSDLGQSARELELCLEAIVDGTREADQASAARLDAFIAAARQTADG